MPGLVVMVKLFWNFFKRLFSLNLQVSVLFSILNFDKFLLTLGWSLMSSGFIISLLYHHLTHKMEYYFYYNQGISKIKLISVIYIVDILIGFILVLIYYGFTSGS
jgi:hypothetical protein